MADVGRQRRQEMRVFRLVLPFGIPILFYFLYQPINRAWTVKRFGCGCPSLDLSWRFNANHFNTVLLLPLLAGCMLLWIREIKRVTSKEARCVSCGAGIVGILLVFIQVWARRRWL